MPENIGSVIQITGPAVNVQFTEAAMPPIYEAVRVTSVSFDPALSQPGTSPWLGDYQGLAVGPRTIYPFWNDTRTGHMALFTSAIPGT